MTAKTFTTMSVKSTHGTRKAAEASAARYAGWASNIASYEVTHTGPRLFAVIQTVTITSSPAPVRHVMDNSQIVCECGSTDWFYTGRTLFNLNYECAACARTISPVSETGASQ